MKMYNLKENGSELKLAINSYIKDVFQKPYLLNLNIKWVMFFYIRLDSAGCFCLC